MPPRQRRVVAARPGVARDVDAALSRAQRGSRADRPHHQRRPRPARGWRRRCGRSTTGISAPTGRSAPATPASGKRIDDVDDGELWETHQTLKAQLIDFARRRAAQQAERRGEPPEFVAQLRRALSLDALTIGFARRFATYKRADLMLQDIEAIAALVNNPQMPVQFVFAGKAHPHDGPGKAVLQQIAQLMRDPRFAGKLLFVEDYDINVGRHLVQGVDVWLNNPRRPLEACGTSGQKVVLNGGLNLSILDGWWAEAYDGLNGFAIGMGETHTSTDVHDRARRRSRCCDVLRDEVVPLYYDRDRDGLPREWIARDEARHPHARLALQRRPHGDGLRAARPTSPPPAARAATSRERKTGGVEEAEAASGDVRRAEMLLKDERNGAAQPRLRRRVGRHDSRRHVRQTLLLHGVEHDRSERSQAAVTSPITTISSGASAVARFARPKPRYRAMRSSDCLARPSPCVGESQQILETRDAADLRARSVHVVLNGRGIRGVALPASALAARTRRAVFIDRDVAELAGHRLTAVHAAGR